MRGTATEGAAFDKATLDANTMGDAALQDELFELYFDHAPNNFAMMRAALDDGAARGWKEGAHALKGAARTLGLLALGEAAAAAEAAGPSEARYRSVEAAFEAARAAADAYRAAAKSAK